MNTFKKMKEEELLKWVEKGDEDAFNEIYARYHKLVFYVANKTCRNESDAQDILQETFLAIKDHVKDLRDPKYFRLWVYRIISSKCKNMFKKNQRTVNSFDDAFYENNIIEQRSYLLPRENARKVNDQEVMNEMITRLPAGQCLVVMMFYMEQFSIPEISNILELPQGTVKSRLSTARKSLYEMVMHYNEKTQEPITFRQLSQVLPAALLAGCEAVSVPAMAGVLTTAPISAGSLFHKMTSFASTHVVSASLIGVALTSVAGVAGYGMYQQIQGNQNKQGLPMSQIANDKESHKLTNFKPIAMDSENIDTPKKAFYALQLYACCDQDIQEMSKEQLLAIKELYEEMKLHGGDYYAHLVDIGWANAYEEKTME